MNFQNRVKIFFLGGPLSGGGPRRLPHLPHSKSAPARRHNYASRVYKSLVYYDLLLVLYSHGQHSEYLSIVFHIKAVIDNLYAINYGPNC